MKRYRFEKRLLELKRGKSKKSGEKTTVEERDRQ